MRRRILLVLSAALVAGLLYDGWIFYSRWDRNRQAERQRARQEAEEARRTLDMLGHLKIPDFHAYPAAIKRGSQARVCYSTVGAKNVRMEPPVEGVWPAYGRCVEVSPQNTTLYRLIAEDGSGNSVTKTVTLSVSR